MRRKILEKHLLEIVITNQLSSIKSILKSQKFIKNPNVSRDILPLQMEIWKTKFFLKIGTKVYINKFLL